MGLRDLEDIGEDEAEEQEEKSDSPAPNTPGAYAEALKYYVIGETFDIEVDGDELRGDAQEFAMLFILMSHDRDEEDWDNMLDAFRRQM